MIEYFKDAIAVYKFGSQTLKGIINNPHDVDYLVIYRRREDIDKHCAELNKMLETDTPTNQFWCIALEDLTIQKWQYLDSMASLTTENSFGYLLFRTYLSPMNVLLFHYAELFEGEDVHLADYVKLTDEFLDFLADSTHIVRDKLLIFNKYNPENTNKSWYYVLLGYYICLNSSYTLTDEQQQIVQDAHDNKLDWDTCKLLTAEVNEWYIY